MRKDEKCNKCRRWISKYSSSDICQTCKSRNSSDDFMKMATYVAVGAALGGIIF